MIDTYFTQVQVQMRSIIRIRKIMREVVKTPERLTQQLGDSPRGGICCKEQDLMILGWKTLPLGTYKDFQKRTEESAYLFI